MPSKPNHSGSSITEINDSFGNFTTLLQLEHKFTTFNTNHNKKTNKNYKIKNNVFTDDISIGNVVDDDNIINPAINLKTPNPRTKPTASVHPLPISQCHVVTIPDEPNVQQQQHQQQPTEVLTISDDEEDASLESILKESCSSLHHLSHILSECKRSNFWEKN